ncbi:MAG: transcriptional regulator, ArsR family [Alphaproteobacteria bacterium]|nr:transcriptional regulator, ArsR family [Alphaproteobacteria bacterium]
MLINDSVKSSFREDRHDAEAADRSSKVNKMSSVHDPLSATLSALADPTRRAILARLSRSEANVNEIAEPFGISLPAISRHLKVLEAAGLITRGRSAQWRPCRLEPAPLKALDAWLAQYRDFWEGSFDRMDSYLSRLTKGDPDGRKN